MTDTITGADSFPNRVDDGLYGPDSVSWKLFNDPSAQLGMVCAVLLQALNPSMMRLFDKVSNNNQDPAGRAARTGQFVLTTVFADTPRAEAAGATVRKLHRIAKWTDPQTGDVLEADNPLWLAWTHNSIVWGVLRAAEVWGPKLSVAEQDQFVTEQHKSAVLVGIDPASLPSTKAALDTYLDAQRDWLALSYAAAETSSVLRKPSLRGNPLKTVPAVILNDGLISLLPSWGFTLYGISGRPMNLRLAQRAVGAMLATARKAKPYDTVLRETLAEVDAHPYTLSRSKS
jgi:uncharacterized protein (DUF2236 family)